MPRQHHENGAFDCFLVASNKTTVADRTLTLTKFPSTVDESPTTTRHFSCDTMHCPYSEEIIRDCLLRPPMALCPPAYISMMLIRGSPYPQ